MATISQLLEGKNDEMMNIFQRYDGRILCLPNQLLLFYYSLRVKIICIR